MIKLLLITVTIVSLAIPLVVSLPVDDDLTTTTNRYYLPTTSSTTHRGYIPAITVRPPRPGSHSSGNRDDSKKVNTNKNKKPEFEIDNELPHTPAEIDEWKKWNTMIDSWYVNKNKSPVFLDSDYNDDDLTYWWFKLPYLYCPPYIRKLHKNFVCFNKECVIKICVPIGSDPVLFKRYYYKTWWPILWSNYYDLSLWRR